MRGDGLGREVDVALKLFLCQTDPGEAVAVGALDLMLRHPGGMVVVPIGDNRGLLILVLGGGAVHQVRCHLTGRHIDDQDGLRSIGQLKHVQVRQVWVDVVADPLCVLLQVGFLGVYAQQAGRLVLYAIDDQTTTGVRHGRDVLGELVPTTIPGRLRERLLPVQVVELVQVAVRGPADHVEGERPGWASEMLVNSCPCACHEGSVERLTTDATRG